MPVRHGPLSNGTCLVHMTFWGRPREHLKGYISRLAWGYLSVSLVELELAYFLHFMMACLLAN